MHPPKTDAVNIAILAKAPMPGFAKTRLIPALGAHGAAVLQERFIEHTVKTAVAAAIGPVSLWATPDPRHRSFQDIARDYPVTLEHQPDGELGVRMLAAMIAARGPVIVVGTDCPALTSDHLQLAASALHGTADVVIAPAEDGGYVMIGAVRAIPALFADMVWSTGTVMAETRKHIGAAGLRLLELPVLWDVDSPADLDRLTKEFPDLAV